MEPSVPLRIFHILSNPTIGGIEGMLSNLIPRVDPTRCDMRIVNMRTESATYELWDQCGVRYYKLKTPGKLLLGSVIGLARLLRREKVDIVEVYGLRANIIGRPAAKIAGVPVVVTGFLETGDWRKWYHIWLDRLTRWAVNGWIPNSKACRQILLKREKHPESRIKVIYDGIDTKKWTRQGDTHIRQRIREEFGCSNEAALCVTVANLRYEKGHPYLIEAALKVLKVNSNIHFALIGADFLRGEIQKRCRQLGLEQSVTFAGYRSDIHDIYEAADIAVLPSLFEGLPICLIEAMSMELPVVATNISGIPELVVDGTTGLLVPPRDPDALSAAIIEMGISPEKRKQMGQAGRQRVNEMFTIERMIEELLNYYQQQFQLATN